MPRCVRLSGLRDIGSLASHVALCARAQLKFTDGDDRLRHRDSRVRSLLFGIAMVPVTHILHTIIADSLVSRATRIADSVLARLSPAPAFAFA